MVNPEKRIVQLTLVQATKFCGEGELKLQKDYLEKLFAVSIK